MRKRHVRNSLDFGYLEYPKIGLRLVKSIQRIMIRAEVSWQTVAANRSMKHPAQRQSIHDAAVDAKPMRTRKLDIHHNENQCALRVADSHRNRSQLHKLSFTCPR